MPVIPDATVKGTASNSYITVARGNQLLTDTRLNVTGWNSASDDDKARAVIYGTYLLDNVFMWHGTPRTIEQKLDWPRSGVYDNNGDDFDYDTIPEPLERAVAEMALQLLSRDRMSDPSLLGLGFSEAKVGSISVKVSEEMKVSLIPDYITTVLHELGRPLVAASGGSGSVKLRRS